MASCKAIASYMNAIINSSFKSHCENFTAWTCTSSSICVYTGGIASYIARTVTICMVV